MRLRTKEIMKKRDGLKNSKGGLTEMNKDRQMKDPVRGEMVQSNIEIAEKTMEEGRYRKA